MDALIIDGMWGKKARSGMLGEYVLALAAEGKPENSLSKFLSFCRSVRPSAARYCTLLQPHDTRSGHCCWPC